MSKASRSHVLSEEMSRRLQIHDVDGRVPADMLIGWASWNLDAAQLGWDLLQQARPEGDDNFTGHRVHTVEFAALNLVFRGVVTAMDQCAGAIFRLSGEQLRPDREQDVGWWLNKRSNPPWERVNPPLAGWLRELGDAEAWALATGFRDALTHRAVQRHITILIGSPRGGVAHLEVNGEVHEAEEAMLQTLLFGADRYASFAEALALAYPT